MLEPGNVEKIRGNTMRISVKSCIKLNGNVIDMNGSVELFKDFLRAKEEEYNELITVVSDALEMTFNNHGDKLLGYQINTYIDRYLPYRNEEVDNALIELCLETNPNITIERDDSCPSFTYQIFQRI